MDAIDNKFMHKIRPVFKHLLSTTYDKYPNLCKQDIDRLEQSLFESATDNLNYCFTHIPEIGHTKWSDAAW